MPDHIIVIPGSADIDIRLIKAAVENFGWNLQVTDAQAAVRARENIAAVLLQLDSLSDGCLWVDTLRTARSVFPGTHLICCFRFGESIDWPLLSEAGAFHGLWLPLQENEVRQSLGFVWATSRQAINRNPRLEEHATAVCAA